MSSQDQSDKSHPQTFLEPEAGTCQVVLVRHGQSIPFVEGQPFPLKDGHGDPQLSPNGLMQADAVGSRLQSEPISAIYASSLQRTQQTAAPLADALGHSITIDPDLREVFLGEFEGGLFRQRAAEGHPAVEAFRTNREWGEIPGAETNDDLRSRTVASIERIALTHPDEMVAVFCHGGVIAALLGHAQGVNQFMFRGCRNGAVNHLYVSEAEWLIRSFNDASHIGGLTFDLTA